VLPEKLDQIVDAIVDGKYSWACVLLLRSNGLNPLHYIPYRTYNRLLKENIQGIKQPLSQTEKVAQSTLSYGISPLRQKQEQRVAVIDDLPHLETISQSRVRGGMMSYNSIYAFGKMALSS
jgi:hypothetical protein